MNENPDTPVPTPTEGTYNTTTHMTVLGNPQLFALLMSAIDERVAARTRERNENLRNWLIGILTVAVIAATAAGGLALDYFAGKAVKDTVETNLSVEVQRAVDPAVVSAVERALDASVKGAVEDAVQRIVDPAVERAVNATRFDSAVAALNFRVLNLDIADGFAADEANFIIREIKTLYSQLPDAKTGEKLVFAVESAAESFAAAGRPDLVNRLEDAAPDVLRISSTVTSVMVQTEGFVLLSDAGSPRSWQDPDGVLKGTYDSYRRYAGRAKVAGYPELYLAYEMLLRYIASEDTEEIQNLIDDADDLNEQDAEGFITLVSSLAVGTMTRIQDAASQRASERTRAFLCAFGTRGRWLPTIVDRVELSARVQICA